MLFKYKTKNGEGEVSASSAEGAAAKILIGEPVAYGWRGNYYMPPMIFYGALSRIELRLWLLDPIIQEPGLIITSPKELKNKRKWL